MARPIVNDALDWAIELSQLARGTIAVVYVSEPIMFTSMYGGEGGSEIGKTKIVQEMLAEIADKEKKMIEEAKVYCENRAVNVKVELLHGNIAQTIINYAKEQQIDLIIAGTKGHGALEELLMGSVTRNLVSLAHVPVLVVKE
jgi:nucleotide-binding universal stress UspA family protein